MTDFLTAEQIKARHPDRVTGSAMDARARARQRVEAAGQSAPWQALGRRFAIGCVALEITQRCNLDCTYCYLSETSEALRDIPLAEVFRRIELIHQHYGDGTDIQVTGGEPTLRARAELLAIVRYIVTKRMRATLLTNGIRATRGLLVELVEAGLTDVAFHVDLTQRRPHFTSEIALNQVRKEYLERARGLPLSVFFNTTICEENRLELPSLVQFFKQHCDTVRMCSFQIGANTGRGIGRVQRALLPHDIIRDIETGMGAQLNFDAAGTGPRACNRYGFALVINGNAYDLFEDGAFVQRMVAETADVYFDRRHWRRAVWTMLRFLFTHPRLLGRALKCAGKLAWRAKVDLLAARGRIRKLSFFVHHFMAADALEASRIDACSFMVMTPDGPLSMCLHNAKRDDYLLVPAQVRQGDTLKFWDPVSGRLQARLPSKLEVKLTRKTARGGARAALNDPPRSIHAER